MVFEKFRLWGKKNDETQDRVEPTLSAQEMGTRMKAGAEAPLGGIEVRNVGAQQATQPESSPEEDPNVAAAMASIQEEDTGALAVPPSETVAPASMTVGPNFKRSSASSFAQPSPKPAGMESVPPASAVNVMPEASVVGEAPAEQLPSSLQQREFEHLQSNRPHTSVPPQSAADRLMSSAAIPPQVEASPQTAALKNDLDALIGKAEAAQKTETGSEGGSRENLEEALGSYLYAGGRLQESTKDSLRRIHDAALASANPHERALELYQEEFKNAYDADLQEAFLGAVLMDSHNAPSATSDEIDPSRIRPDGKIEPTLSKPKPLTEGEQRDMGDGRTEPPRLKIKRQPEEVQDPEIDDATLDKELGAVAASLLPKDGQETPQAEKKVKGMILDTDPQVKLLKQKLNQGTLTREQYYREIAKMQAALPEVTVPAEEGEKVPAGTPEKEQPQEPVVAATGEKAASAASPTKESAAQEAPTATKQSGPVVGAGAPTKGSGEDSKRVDEAAAQGEGQGAEEEIKEGELWSIEKKKQLHGAALASATRAQQERIEALIPQGTSNEGGTGGGNEEGAPIGSGSEGGESTFLQLEMFTFSEAFTERVKTLLEKATQQIDEDEAMDILDSLADALLRDNEAKFERQKNKLRALCGDTKTEGGGSLLDALLFELQREILRNAVEQTEKRKAREAAQQPEERSYSGEQMDQVLLAIAAAEQRGFERATEVAKELTKLSVEKAEARGVGKALRAIVTGAALGAVTAGGSSAVLPTLGVAIGGLTIGTAAVVGGGLGIAVAGTAMAIAILNKEDKNKQTT